MAASPIEDAFGKGLSLRIGQFAASGRLQALACGCLHGFRFASPSFPKTVNRNRKALTCAFWLEGSALELVCLFLFCLWLGLLVVQLMSTLSRVQSLGIAGSVPVVSGKHVLLEELPTSQRWRDGRSRHLVMMRMMPICIGRFR